MVRCKFLCESKRSFTAGPTASPKLLYDYAFRAVYGNSPENAVFWEWTPGGTLSVTSVRDSQFEPGTEYFIDISPAV